MNNITKVSEITYSDVADYIRLSSEQATEEQNTLTNLINISKDYIKQYTGITSDTELDKYNDLVIVVLILCQSMYDDRTLYVDSTNLNKVVETILDMHSKNLLPSYGKTPSEEESSSI